MSFTRRKFLILGSLSSLGIAGIWKLLQVENEQGMTATATTPANLGTAQDLLAAPASSPLLRFISVADTGTGAQGQYAVAAAMTRYHRENPFNLAVLAGDNIYNNGEIEKIHAVFEKPYQDLLQNGVKFYACLGNHDIRTANGDPQVKYPGFNMQGRYYTIQQEPVQFFALDTNSNADWTNQLVWLERELQQSTAPWKIVFGHHQIYASGVYGLNQPFVETLTPLFKRYGVQLYLNGHEHHYERTRSIQGTTYLTCGGGGGVRPVGRSEWTDYSVSQLSFAAFEVYADRILIKGINTKYQVFDQGIIPLHSA